MSWVDRIKTAAYTSPSGIRTVFDFRDVEETFERNSSVFRFPDKDGALVTAFSSSERRYPITAYLSGTDYDIFSNLFMSALYESGNGLLEHPMYGFKTVQVLSVRRQDNLASGANQAVFTIEFAETLDVSFPLSLTNIANDIVQGIDIFNALSADDYSNDVNYTEVDNKLNGVARWNASLDVINSYLEPIARLDQSIFERYTTIFSSLENNMNTLIDDPETLASQINLLIEVPAAVDDIDLILQQYIQLALCVERNSRINFISINSRNIVIETTVILTAIVISMCKSTLDASFKTRIEAITTSEIIRGLNAYVTEAVELRQRKFQVDSLDLLLYGDGDLANSVNNVVTNTYADLTQQSFTLAQKRCIFLSEDRTLIDLSYQLYGSSSDDKIELLINVNNLQGDEILLIPRGKEVFYFV